MYRGTYVRDGRPVAVKIVAPDPQADAPIEVVRLIDAETREELARMVVRHAQEGGDEPRALPRDADPQPPSTPEPTDGPIDSNRSSSTEEGAVA